MKIRVYFSILSCMLIFGLTSCDDLLEDTDLNPIYFVECEIDGEKFRAQTNNNAWLSWGISEGEYSIIGQNVTEDKNINITLFEELGEGKIETGIEVNTYFTNIVFFTENKSFLAFPFGEGGFIDVESLTDTEAIGTFEGVLGEKDNPSNTKKITKGKFKVKTR